MNTTQFDALIDWAPAGFSQLLVGLSRLSLDLQNSIQAESKPDGTLVTQADTRIEDLLSAYLNEHDEGSFIVGEETLSKKGSAYLSQALTGKTWVIDPIDGTALYALGMEGWGISIGLMIGGKMEHGVVAYPSRSVAGSVVELLFSQADRVVWAQAELGGGDAGVVQALQTSLQSLPVRPPIPGFPGMIATSQRISKWGTFSGPQALVSFASAVQTFRYLMKGMLCGYVVKLKVWDIAAVLPMAWRLGIRACKPDGLAFDLDVSAEVWNVDPTDPAFLASKDHVLFYRPERIGPEMWEHITLPKRS